MSNAASITAEAFEILVLRELRKVGIEPPQMRRQSRTSSEAGFGFDLIGKLECYGQRWSALIECRHQAALVTAMDVDALRARADEARAVSALLCTAAVYLPEAVARGQALRVPLLRVVDAQQALTETGMIQAGQLPAWVPEFTLQLVTAKNPGRLLEANDPEQLLRELRTSGSS